MPPRRCFICLSDEGDELEAPMGGGEGDGDGGGLPPLWEWVEPCPCTLEAHQRCMLLWIDECERESKPIACPICKAAIGIVEPGGVISGLLRCAAVIHRSTPWLIGLSVVGSVELVSFSHSVGSAVAFAGRDSVARFIFRAYPAVRTQDVHIPHVLLLSLVSPALLVCHVFPMLGTRLIPVIGSMVCLSSFSACPPLTFCPRFLPRHICPCFLNPSSIVDRGDGHFHTDWARQYLSYKSLLDPDLDLLAWPPRPEVAAVGFLCLRSAYWNLYKRYVRPIELRINTGEPDQPAAAVAVAPGVPEPAEPAGEPVAAVAAGAVAGAADQRVPVPFFPRLRGWNGNVRLFRAGLRLILALLDHPGQNNEIRGAIEIGAQNRIDAGAFEIEIEAVVGRMNDEDAGPVVQAAPGLGPQPGPEQVDGAGNPEPAEPARVELAGPAAPAEPALPVVPEGQVAPAEPQGAGQINGRIAPAPISFLFRCIRGWLLLPVICWGAGELLRIALPVAWTTVGHRARPGLLSKQWGRSLVGGCLCQVLCDALRVYLDARHAAIRSVRRVKNVERKRGPS